MAHPHPLKNVNLAPLLKPFKVDMNVVSPHYRTPQGNETFEGRLDAKFTVQSQVFPSSSGDVERRIVHVDLEGSEFGAPSNMKDQNDLRGFFIENIHYQMWLQSHGASPNPKTPIGGWQIMREGPNTTNQTGSITSSISYGFDASIGAMGDLPMGTVGGHLGVSTSHTHTLTDFTFMQHSDAQILKHEINMTMLGDGTPYTDESDFMDQWQSPFVGARMRPLSNMAKSNVPLLGQAFWMNTDPSGLVDKLTLHIAITPKWHIVQGMADGFSVHHWGFLYQPTQHYSQDIDFGLLS